MSAFLRTFVLALACLFLAANLPAQQSNSKTTLVVGPTVFTIHNGSPTVQTLTFSRPPQVYGPFSLLVAHQNLSGIRIELNGEEVFGSSPFDSRPLSAFVALKPENTLRVELTGIESASATLMITGSEYAFASLYKDLTVAPETSAANDVSGSVDWRSKGAVTPVKDQGQCGSDWAFSDTGVMEGLAATSGKTLPSLSEQQLVDCAHFAEVQGCNGGDPAQGLRYYLGKGPANEASYLYTGRDGMCKMASAVLPTIRDVVKLPQGDEAALLARVAQQPVSVVLRIGTWFQTYKAGVANPNCDGDATGFQSLLVVGYTPTYWIIKNSWGTSWGMGGYLELQRGGNKCGIADYASVPIY